MGLILGKNILSVDFLQFMPLKSCCIYHDKLKKKQQMNQKRTNLQWDVI